MEEIKYTIPLPPITKKNSQQILTNPKTGRPFIMPSAKYKQYEREAVRFLRPALENPIDYPVNIKCLFFLPTKRKTDLTNLLEAVDDLLVHAVIIDDDHYGIVAAHDGSRCYYSKENPRTEIIITRLNENDRNMEGCAFVQGTIPSEQPW